MRSIRPIDKLVAALLSLLLATPYAYAAQPVTARVSVCFTPAEQCEDRIVSAIDRAESSIRVQAYGFTSLPIIHALQRAAERGIEVLAILDKTNERKYSGATLLEAAGIPVWIDYEPAIAHSKVIVIDGHLASVGLITTRLRPRSGMLRMLPSWRAMSLPESIWRIGIAG